MISIWSKTADIPRRENLKGRKETEVAVIGAGMTGLLTAYYLQKQGKKVIVLEADRIAGGQTENTTAKITSQHGKIYGMLIKNCGEEKAELYARANEQAIGEYEKIVKDEQIDCHFERVPSYLYSTERREDLQEEAQAAKKLGIQAYYTENIPLPFSVKGAVCFENQAQFHPLEFIKQIQKNLTIYEKTKVLRIKGHCIFTEYGMVEAEKIVIATHYPFPKYSGFYFLRQHQERSYVLALSGIPKWDGMYYSADEDGLSFRWYENFLLMGGGGHRTGSTKEEYGYEVLRKKAENLFTDYKEETFWAAQDCITHDHLPFIGGLSYFHPDWYVITGLKKWGMTGAMVAANIITDQICGRENPYEKLFTPKRIAKKGSFGNIWKDLKISVKGLGKGHFHIPFQTFRNLPLGAAQIFRIGWRRYGIYRDFDGVYHKIKVKCPHLGCELTWNEEERTWDCPCHGSRFDFDGKLLDDPAQTDVSRQ